MPIFRVKSVKIYTGQKKFTRIYSWRSWQIWGMTFAEQETGQESTIQKNFSTFWVYFFYEPDGIGNMTKVVIMIILIIIVMVVMIMLIFLQWSCWSFYNDYADLFTRKGVPSCAQGWTGAARSHPLHPDLNNILC